MRRVFCALLLGMFLAAGGTVAAQEATPQTDEGGGFELASSATLLSKLGLPELNLAINDDGSIDLPSQLTAGRYLLTLSGSQQRGGEIYFLQPPATLSEVELKAAMLTLISDDIAAEGWVYGGGAFTLPGQSFSIVFDLEPGEWTTAISVENPNNEGGIVDVLFHKIPVTGDMPALAEVDAAITVEMADFSYSGLESATSAPQIWKLANSGVAPHMVSLFRTPRLLDADDVLAVFISLSTGGTPPAGVPGIEEWQPVGYVQVISPGQSVWVEWTFAPADYMALCFVAGDDGMPHLALGMAQGFVID